MIYRLFIFLFAISLNAQIVSVGFDMQNALYGSNVNKPSLDIQIKVASVTNNREIGFEFENFSEIKYMSYGMYFNHVVRLKKVELAIGGEGLLIIRGDLGSLAYGFNGEVRYFFTDKIGISAQLNYRRRTDLQLLYYDGRFVESGFINLIYKWK